ncbi:MAG TPA: hypothetical protein VNI20_13570 [Fimbriimonadaceae bacterium]|nr:hypothetical protein [Fimbriimonadaceae bacterium]
MGRHWIGIALGAGLGAAFTLGMLSLTEKRPPESKKTEAKIVKPVVVQPVVVKEGTPVSLVLLDPLHSGGSDVGELATVVVSHDVTGEDGRVAIPAGAVGQVEVVRSREASVMTTLVNQPARLWVRFLPLDLGGTKVKLSASDSEDDDFYEVDRDDASAPRATRALVALWRNRDTREFLTSLSDRMNGDSSDTLDDPKSRQVLADVAQKLDMKATKESSSKSGFSVGALFAIGQKADNGDLKTMDSGEVVLAVRALVEMCNVSRRVDHGLRGRVKGRNISAPIGTVFNVFVSGDVSLPPE